MTLRPKVLPVVGLVLVWLTIPGTIWAQTPSLAPAGPLPGDTPGDEPTGRPMLIGPQSYQVQIDRLPKVGGAEDPEWIDKPPRSETLEEAWMLAVALDDRLAAQQWRLSALEHAQGAACAQRWPTATLDASYILRDNEPSFVFGLDGLPVPDTFPFAQRDSMAARARIDYPLYTAGRIDHQILAAEANVLAAELGLSDEKSQLKLRVARLYVGVLRAERELKVAQSNERSLASHAHDTQLLFQNERVPQNDLLAAQVALANARQRTIAAANRLDFARASYNRQLGRPLSAPVVLVPLQQTVPRMSVDVLTDRALVQRPELARLSAQADARGHEAQVVRAQNRPRVDLRGQYAYEENEFVTPQAIASLAVVASWNVFDAGRRSHEATALADQSAALVRLKADAESIVRLEVRQAWLDVRETQQRLQATQQALQQSEENLRVTRQRYQAGRGTNTEVLDAEALRLETIRNHINAQYDLVLAALRLRRATGDL